MDGIDRLVSGAHRLDDAGRTGNRISAGENMRDVCLHGMRIYSQQIPTGPFQIRNRFRPGAVRCLTDGRDDRIAGNNKFRPFLRHRATPAAFIRGPQLGLDAFDAGNPTVFFKYSDRCGEILKPDRFFDGTFDLFSIRGHLFFGATVDHRYGIRPQTSGHTGRIDGHIAAADHNDLFSDIGCPVKVDIA